MLLTNITHELPQFPFMAAAGTQAWRTIGLELNVPYVFVSFSIKEGRIWLSQTAILWREDDVLDFCRDGNASPSRKIRHIAVLMPPNFGSSGSWSMVQVKEVWAGQIRGMAKQMAFYVGLDGHQIMTGTQLLDGEKIEYKKREYRYRTVS